MGNLFSDSFHKKLLYDICLNIFFMQLNLPRLFLQNNVESSLIKMGFPSHYSVSGREKPSMCVW